MSSLADSLISSISRPLRLRMRPDLTAVQHVYNRRVFWVVKEPLALKFFRFQEEEYAILQMLDGRASMEDIKNKFDRQFAPQQIEYRDLQHFIGTLHQSGLVVATTAGQGMQLWRRGKKQRWKKLLAQLTNVFALRWRGVDPERFLNWLYPWTKWFFTRWALFFCVFLAVSALAWIVVQFGTFTERLPAFHEFFGPLNWVWLFLTLAVVKILHELAHGLSCKHFGGECHEIGFMLLVFTPALYCNVSDSWLLKSKWQRAAIGAAGIYVEVTLASIATVLWWFSEPGLFNHICLSVMFICSVNTILFNGNPLLRFDGYYILADLVEIPNLRQKATEVLRRWIFGVCLGVELPEDPFLPKRRRFFLAMYTVLAVVYRWLVVLSICWFLNAVLKPYGLQIIGRIIAAIGFFGLVVVPAWQFIQFFRVPGRYQEVKTHRVVITLAVLGSILAFVFFVPLPHYVRCSFTIEPQDALAVYVEVPGRLEDVLVEAGQPVVKGQPLARLVSPALQLEASDLELQANDLQAQMARLDRLRYDDPDAIRRKLRVQEQLATILEQLAQNKMKREQLTIKAPTAGVVYRAGVRPREKSEEGSLPTWSGWPLDEENKDADMREGQVLCQIGDPVRRTAVLAVDQGELKLVERGQRVSLKLQSLPGKTIVSQIDDVALRSMPFAPQSMTNQAGGDIATSTDQRGAQKPLSAKYEAHAELGETENDLQVGLRGQAKIEAGYSTLGSRMWRGLLRLFNFEL